MQPRQKSICIPHATTSAADHKDAESGDNQHLVRGHRAAVAFHSKTHVKQPERPRWVRRRQYGTLRFEPFQGRFCRPHWSLDKLVGGWITSCHAIKLIEAQIYYLMTSEWREQPRPECRATLDCCASPCFRGKSCHRFQARHNLIMKDCSTEVARVKQSQSAAFESMSHHRISK